jgi:hypothetical protein
MESTRGNTHSVTFFPPGNVFFGSMISTMHPLTTNTAAVLLEGRQGDTGWKPVLRGNGERGGLTRSVYGRIVLFTSPHHTC